MTKKLTLTAILALSLFSVLCTSCSKSESAPKLETITYAYEASENLLEMVDLTIHYIDKDRKLVSENLRAGKWEKKILVNRPFYAEMQITCKRNPFFLPQKEYYSVYRKLTINESVSFVQNNLSSRSIFDYIDNLCSRTQTIFFEIK